MLGYHRKTWLATARSPLAALALLLLCAAVYLPGLFALPPVDRDECRFAQASRQMFEAHALPADQLNPRLHSGGWAVPYFTDTPRLNKPPLIYWLQVGSAWLFTLGQPLSDAIWMYRVPSVMSAMVTVLATWWFGKRWLDPRAAWLAAALLAVAPMIVWDANQARADQLLVACTTVAMGALGVLAVRGLRFAPASETQRTGTAGGWVWPLVFWFAVAAGVMAKGFVTPLVAGLAVVTLSAATRRWTWVLALRPWLGMVILPAAVVPWLYFVAQHQGGIGPFIQQAFGEFFVRAAAGSKEGHFAPPGTHLVLLAVLFWPGSLLTLLALGHAIRRAKGHALKPPTADTGWWTRLLTLIRTPWRGRPIELFLLAWIVPMWVLFELSMAKLPHYTMPMYPAVALLSARMVFRVTARAAKGEPVQPPALGRVLWCILPVVLGLAQITIGGLLLMLGIGLPSFALLELVLSFALLVLVPSAMLFSLGWWAVRSANRGRTVRAQLLSLALPPLMLPFLLVIARVLLPGWSSAEVAAQVGEPAYRDRPLALLVDRPSLRFGLRNRGEYITPEALQQWVYAHPGGLVVLPNGANVPAGLIPPPDSGMAWPGMLRVREVWP
jgi:4-amino-4-deoxy-L-arabinose transferase-like glycosyltransferase